MRVLLCASTGKDSVWALHTLRASEHHDVVAMLTTFGEVSGRVPFQNASHELVQTQAAALGVEVLMVGLPTPCSGVQYESALNMAIMDAKRDHEIEALAFADVYREEMKIYRDKLFAQMDLKVLYPLWSRDTGELAREMIDAGLRAKISCVNLKVLPASFVGREFDHQFLADLPAGADPCGELGGFRTFAYDGPMFQHPVPLLLEEAQEVNGFQIVHLNVETPVGSQS